MIWHHTVTSKHHDIILVTYIMFLNALLYFINPGVAVLYCYQTMKPGFKLRRSTAVEFLAQAPKQLLSRAWPRSRPRDLLSLGAVQSVPRHSVLNLRQHLKYLVKYVNVLAAAWANMR